MWYRRGQAFPWTAAINLWRRARGSDGRSWNCRYLFLVRPGRWRSWKGSFPWRRPRGTWSCLRLRGMRQEAGTFVFPPVRRRGQRRKRCVSHGDPHPGRPGRLGGRGSFRKRIPADQPVYSADRAAGFADSGYPVEQYRRKLLRQGDFEDPLLAAALFLKYRYRSG